MKTLTATTVDLCTEFLLNLNWQVSVGRKVPGLKLARPAKVDILLQASMR
jgi:hypothetical protein